MACGKLVKILLHSKVTRYLDFKSVDGSYVLKDGKVQKVPATPAEAMSSSLMGFFEKRKFRNFLMFLNAYDVKTPSTYLKGIYMLLIFHDFSYIHNHTILFSIYFHF
jgi:Rab GDP dissociation inhibitor